MSSSDRNFEGWAGVDDRATKGGMVLKQFQPKPWDDNDIEVKVLYCGICGSDVHSLSGSWGPLDPSKPNICGHEIVGQVVQVGTKVDTSVKVGDYVGIGAQSDSCRQCEWCLNGEEEVCASITWTMNSPFQHGNAKAAGFISCGGFANYWRGPAQFAVKVPDGLDLGSVAPMLCGGITVYSPLEQYGAGTRAKRVGVIGIGGLGHYAVLFAKAMGAEVTAISRGTDKMEDAKKLGADKYIAMSEGIKGHENSVDLIICTINPDTLDVLPYMPLLRPHGTLCLVGIVRNPLSVPCFSLISGNRRVAGSNVGSPAAIGRMLQLVVDKKIESWVQRWSFNDINKALPAFEEGKPRFRFVMVNTENGGKL
ncbi:hypothetical protein I302_108573 [Kwoniella bestiolae CBS 10118]|uniref:Enoyl reductase (ER) domain-containing protein n=1 Tax=Kwoniella bestiolae CBS 10118 TaxID=1296100 RepID=A0A1B9FVC4_9TREE|nr:hypothetical protein I302_07054 [Kwoniella bestiolae CBS 10118]OCF22714.1 hypothetical protein I302_07054 [Kwoniella bestiolae CBS 10118]